MAICQVPDCDEHFACRLRGKGVQIGTLATPSKPKKGRLTPTAPQTHLAEVTYDERPNGTRMPILNPDGTPVRKAQARAEERKLTEFRRQLHQSSSST